MICSFKAIDCGDPTGNITSLGFYVRSTTISITIYNSIVTVGCEFGLKFVDGPLTKSLMCTSFGSWSFENLTSCIGMTENRCVYVCPG